MAQKTGQKRAQRKSDLGAVLRKLDFCLYDCLELAKISTDNHRRPKNILLK
jgi:hypothetical protein